MKLINIKLTDCELQMMMNKFGSKSGDFAQREKILVICINGNSQTIDATTRIATVWPKR